MAKNKYNPSKYPVLTKNKKGKGPLLKGLSKHMKRLNKNRKK